jgi:hypothetical protein
LVGEEGRFRLYSCYGDAIDEEGAVAVDGAAGVDGDDGGVDVEHFGDGEPRSQGGTI